MILSAFSPRRLARLFASDALNVVRDPTLVFVLLLSALPVSLWVWVGDDLVAWVEGRYGFADTAAWLGPILLALPAAMIGWVVGFLLVEDRDDGPLFALDVSPLGKEGFLAYRLLATITIAAAVTLVAVPVLRPGAGVGTALALAAMVALQAAAMATVLPAVARNKVEGLALTKVLNLFAFTPLLAAIPGGWRFLGAWVPGFWLGELGGFFGPPGLGAPLTAVLGIAVHIGALVLALRVLRSRRG